MTPKKVLWSETIRSRVLSGPAHFLSRSSLKTRSTPSGATLLESAIDERPDLIVLSDDLEEMPAIQVYRQLRGDDRTKGIPILVLPREGEGQAFRDVAGSEELLDVSIDSDSLQHRIISLLGLMLRRHPRFPVVLPVSRGRFFHEFLGYSNMVSEGGMGFETLSRVKKDECLPLRIYRNTEEKPIVVTGRVRGVRPNIDTGLGYAVGVEFQRLREVDRDRLIELFPADSTVIWGEDPPPSSSPESSTSGA